MKISFRLPWETAKVNCAEMTKVNQWSILTFGFTYKSPYYDCNSQF